MNKKFKLIISALILTSFTALTGCGKGKPKEVKLDDKIQWSFKTEGAVNSSPVLYKDSNIIVGSNDKNLYSIDINTKAKAWNFLSDGIINNKPIIDGDNVIFSTKSTVYSLNASTGEKNWSFTNSATVADAFDKYDYHAPHPKLYNDLVIFPSKAGTLYAINKSSGEKSWEINPKDGSIITAVSDVVNNKVAIGDVKGNGYVIDLEKKETIYSSYIANGSTMGQVQIHGAALYKDYAYFSGRPCKVVAVNLNTLNTEWSYLEPIGSWFTCDIVAKDDTIYVPGSDSLETLAFNYKSGELTKKYQTYANSFATPVIDNNILYVTDGNVYTDTYGDIMGYDLANNNRIFHLSHSASIYSSPVIKDGLMYFGSTDGNIYCAKTTDK